LDTEDVGGCTVGFRRRTRDRKAKGAGGEVSIELSIEGIVPLVPVGEALKALAGESGKLAFFVGHVGSL
jgi:hypothetical protein